MPLTASLLSMYLLCVIDMVNSQLILPRQTGTLGVPSELDSNLGRTGAFLSNNVLSGSERFSDVGDMNRESQKQGTSSLHFRNSALVDSVMTRNTGFKRSDINGPPVPFANVGKRPPPIKLDRRTLVQRKNVQNTNGVGTSHNEITFLPIDSATNSIQNANKLAIDDVEQNQNSISNTRSIDTGDQPGLTIASVSIQAFIPVDSRPIPLPYKQDQSGSNTRRFLWQLESEGSQVHDSSTEANVFLAGTVNIQNDTKFDLFGNQFVSTVISPRNRPQLDTPWYWQSLEISDGSTIGSVSNSQNPISNAAVSSGSGNKKSSRGNTGPGGPFQQPGFKQDVMNGFNTQQPGNFNGNNTGATSLQNALGSSNILFSSRRTWNGVNTNTLPRVSPFSAFTTESGKFDISSGSSDENFEIGTTSVGTFSSSSSSSTGGSLGTLLFTPTLRPLTITSQQETIPCSEEYQALRGHTLCMDDDPRVVVTGVTAAQQMAILNLHNELRSDVQPPASDLVALKWDERLAIIAAKWAKQCTLGHDTERRVPEIGTHIGQNVAVGYETWEEAMRMWYSEIRIWQYGIDPDTYLGTGRWREVAHFTQIVQNTTYLVGCGYAECRNTPYLRFYVCNYAAGQSDLAYPYTAGSRCGACTKNCNNGLCDCGNKVCYNKGTLDPNTCTCNCRKPYAGSMCDLLDCPVEDNWICGRDWHSEHCSMYYNVPELCPHMCGLCKGGGGVGRKSRLHIEPNKTFVSGYGCRYSGIRAAPEECTRYGDHGADMNMCASEGGTIGCGECDRFFNIKRDYCPVMCGLCNAPCDGKKCMNRGTLDAISCKCTCRPPFTGFTCEQVNCPPTGDPAYCRLWPRQYCGLYYNVPEECPYMCDLCSRTTTRADQLSTR